MQPVSVMTICVGELATNCYIIVCERSREAIIIDPGDASESIADALLAESLTPVAIVLTHGHFDHVLGVFSLAMTFSLPVFLDARDTFLLDRAQHSARHWLSRQVDVTFPASLTNHPQAPILFGECALECIPTPGHTPGSICATISCQSAPLSPPILFTGDTLFQGSFGRTDFSYASSFKLYDSLSHLFSLPLNTLCYPGHGDTTSLKEELDRYANLLPPKK